MCPRRPIGVIGGVTSDYRLVDLIQLSTSSKYELVDRHEKLGESTTETNNKEHRA